LSSHYHHAADLPSKLGAYLKTKEATGTIGHTDQPNPFPDLN